MDGFVNKRPQIVLGKTDKCVILDVVGRHSWSRVS